VPEAAGKAASFALISGAADARQEIPIKPAIKKVGINFILTPKKYKAI
jgi:hypothetical protein